MSNKLIKSTRTMDEHVENLLAVREGKSKGKADGTLCQELSISHSTLQKYKNLIASQDVEALSPDYQLAKRCEIDEQLQAVIRKLFSVVNTVDVQHNELCNDVQDFQNNPEISIEERLRIKKFSRYPVEDLVELNKLILNAVDLRGKIWGLDREKQERLQVNNNRKIVFELNPKIGSNANKLNTIADSIIDNFNKEKVN